MRDAKIGRHDLVRLASSAWDGLLGSEAGSSHGIWLARWRDAGWPLVGRRRGPCDSPDEVPLGLPLPPAAGKARVALAVARRAIVSVGPPPALAEARSAVPPRWRPVVDELVRLGDSVGPSPRLFGSIAWAALTGLAYSTRDSDLDVLWRLGEGQDTAPLLRGLTRIEAAAPMRLDGEIVWPDGRAVQWKELASGASKVLVKTLDSVALVETASLLAPVGR